PPPRPPLSPCTTLFRSPGFELRQRQVAAIAQEQKGSRVIARVELEMAGDVDHGIVLAQRRAQGGVGKCLIEADAAGEHAFGVLLDRKSRRLNSSHDQTS